MRPKWAARRWPTARRAADGQLAGTPSAFFDVVDVILSNSSAKALPRESAAIDFVRDAFGRLKAIVVDTGGHALLKIAQIGSGAGHAGDGIQHASGPKDKWMSKGYVPGPDCKADFDTVIETAKKHRMWYRERRVRPPR